MLWLGLFLLLAACVAGLPFWLERRRAGVQKRTALAGERRIGAEGARTLCRWQGPVKGPVALCIHGLTTPQQAFDPLAPHLARMGFRVLTYDLPGRGGSEARAGEQDTAFFLAQLQEVLEAQGVEHCDLVIGYSMGGSIAAAFAADAPHRVGHLVLLAPAGLGLTLPRWQEIARDVPGLGDWLMLGVGRARLAQAFRTSAAAENAPPDILAAQLSALAQRGFLPAVLSSLRYALSEDGGPAQARLAEAGVPLLAIWGAQDAVIPKSALGRLAQINRAARQEVLETAGHGLPYTHADSIAAELRGFLREL
ncbi:alpha/beta fold hydrolase [Pseudoruegeria sp. SHC-113]|uniref:alpha/beta fold hydrolase n=1 Tax=Pseudoruegeria sp. SHC-113 TaxID=2855439 RepID=UPI0021BA924A|nr:alpha/beta hydrolase [Pseudoruegeria sp. SHC-113]MCT8159056.1 alpha/beta hydrolase [Pseudoruegeria sp. SHC-113]